MSILRGVLMGRVTGFRRKRIRTIDAGFQSGRKMNPFFQITTMAMSRSSSSFRILDEAVQAPPPPAKKKNKKKAGAPCQTTSKRTCKPLNNPG
jgi:hypothetical protein